MSQLGEALFTKTQQKVLGLLYAQADKSFYTKEIIRLTGMGVATIKRELDRMVIAEILTLTKIGNQHHYQANPECPIFHELLGIVKKTFGVADQIKAKLKILSDSIEFAFIYGSISRGTESKISDIDLMLIGSDLNYGAVMEALMPLEESMQRTINPTIYNRKDFIGKLKEGSSFITRVMEQSKIMIKGSDDDLREIR